MTDHSQFIAFLSDHRHIVTNKWISALDRMFPNTYNPIELNKHGLLYFQMVTEMHIPLEQHVLFELLPQWCKILVGKEVPIVQTLYSSHLWRDAVLETICEYYNHQQSFPIQVFHILSLRIDAFERYVCECYWDQAMLLLKEKDHQIHQLHDDRLNTIAKMAASMAHELRNPLTAIGGFLKLLRSNLSQDSLDRVGKYMDVIQTEFENFQMQITGFLSFSKKPVIEEHPINLSISQLIDYVLSLIEPRLVYENICLERERDCAIIILVQKVAMQQVLSNLLNNSIDALSGVPNMKTIKLSCWEDETHSYLSISNNGPRIPEELCSTLFSPFVTGKIDGTGLGLAICKKIMLKNNGDVTFLSSDEETTFILSFTKLGK